MDAWSDQQLAKMKAGGNKRLLDFIQQQGFPDKLSIEEKYDQPAMQVRGRGLDPMPFWRRLSV